MPGFLRMLLSYAFRAFFLLGSACAFAVMLFWTLALLGLGPLADHPKLVYWHAHEMVFGFVAAIVAGFTLTAVATWTGRKPVQGMELGLLVIAWIVGRVAMSFAGDWPIATVAVLDLSFTCLLTILFGREVVASGNWRNAPLVGVVALLAGLNLLFHIGPAVSPGLDRTALLLAVHVVLVLITLIAGRIIPSFTANWLRARGAPEASMPRVVPGVDKAALVMTIATGLCFTLLPTHPASGITAFVAAVVHAVRLSSWSGFRAFSEPLLFILHLAYAWFPIGYALVGLSVFSGYPATAALHALTIGVIVGMIIAMTTRVSLGHTGRPLRAARMTVVIYVLWMATVLVRLIGPLIGEMYIRTVELAATLWMIAFILFAVIYWPILTKPRID